jgi:hypothetical protein
MVGGEMLSRARPPGCERTPIDPRIPQSVRLLQKCVAATGPAHGQAVCVEFRSDRPKAHASALNEFCFLRWTCAGVRLQTALQTRQHT